LTVPQEIHPVSTVRDLLLYQLDHRRVMVVSCDTAGAIGPKSLDRVRVDGRTVGRFTARVALMEALSVGARPLCIVNTMSVEPKRLGEEIRKGVRAEIRDARLNSKTRILQSTEKNFPVRQTGVGVTVIGFASSQSLKIGRSLPGDEVVAVGLPLLGREVLRGERDGKIADARDVRRLVKMRFVHGVIPVGSRGIRCEAVNLAKESGLHFKLSSNLNIDVKRSAGPATSVLCACPPSKSSKVGHLLSKPSVIVGKLMRDARISNSQQHVRESRGMRGHS
jgi:hypothetical protein